ncbi:unnamed protein product [Linum trigynum]|uniref:Uncharacterized protein n=1 Tax=Linum trigynum TaxID=586398 RepID=A0AAV2FZL3_9ROSI
MLQKIQQHIDSVLTQTISTEGDEIGRRATRLDGGRRRAIDSGQRATRLDGGRRAADFGGCEHCLVGSEAWRGGLRRITGTKPRPALLCWVRVEVGVDSPHCWVRGDC